MAMCITSILKKCAIADLVLLIQTHVNGHKLPNFLALLAKQSDGRFDMGVGRGDSANACNGSKTLPSWQRWTNLFMLLKV